MEDAKKAVLAAAAIGTAAVALALAGLRVGAVSGSGLPARMAYPMCHANVLHALANAWCLVAVANVYRATAADILAAYAVAVAVPPFVLSATPTMGLSGACFALIGMMAWRVRRRLYYNAWALAFIAAGFAFHQVNAWLHLWCLAVGELLYAPAPWSKK